MGSTNILLYNRSSIPLFSYSVILSFYHCIILFVVLLFHYLIVLFYYSSILLFYYSVTRFLCVRVCSTAEEVFKGGVPRAIHSREDFQRRGRGFCPRGGFQSGRAGGGRVFHPSGGFKGGGGGGGSPQWGWITPPCTNRNSPINGIVSYCIHGCMSE